MSREITDNLHLSIVKDTNGELVYDWVLDTGTNFEKIDTAVGSINTELTSISSRLDTFSSLKFQKVEVLPDASEASSNIIYLVPNEEHGENNIYDEYILVDNNTQEVSELEGEAEPVLPSFELIGSTYINPASFKVHFSDALPNRAEDGALYAVAKKSFYINDPTIEATEKYVSAIKQTYNGMTFNAGDSLRSYSNYLNYLNSPFSVNRMLKLKTTNDNYIYVSYNNMRNNTNTYYNSLKVDPYKFGDTLRQCNAKVTNMNSPLVSQSISSSGKLQISAYARDSYNALNRYRSACIITDNNDVVKYVSVAALRQYIGKNFIEIPTINWSDGGTITTNVNLSNSIFSFYYDNDSNSYNRTSVVDVYANYNIRLYCMYNTSSYGTTNDSSYRPKINTTFIFEPILENTDTYDLYTYTNNNWILLHGQSELISIRTDLKNEIAAIKTEFDSFKEQINSEIEQRLSQVKQYDRITSFVISDRFDSIKHLNGLDLLDQAIVNVSWYSDDTDSVNTSNYNMNDVVSNLYYNFHYTYNNSAYSVNTQLSSILYDTLYNYNPQYSITNQERARLDAFARVIFTNPYYAYTAKYNADSLVETNISINGNRFASIINKNGIYGLKYKVEIGNIICEVILTTDKGIILYKILGQTDDISLDVQTLNIPQEFVNNGTNINQDAVESFGEHFIGTLFYKKDDDNYAFSDARYFIPNFWQYSYNPFLDGYDMYVDTDGTNPYNTFNGLDYTLTAYNIDNSKVKALFTTMLDEIPSSNGGEFELNVTRGVTKSTNLERLSPHEIDEVMRLCVEYFRIKDLVVVDYYKYYHLVYEKYKNNELKTLDDVVALLNECSGSGATAIGPDGKLYSFYYKLGFIEPDYINESDDNSGSMEKSRSSGIAAAYTSNKHQSDLPILDPQEMNDVVWLILQNLTMTNISFVPLCDDRQVIKDAIQIISDDIGLDDLIDEEYPQNDKGTILDRLDDNEFFIERLVNDVYDDVDGDTVLPQVTENTEFPAPGDAESELDDTINGNTELPIESIVESKDCVTVVDELPEIGVDNALYRVKSTNIIYKCIKSIVESIEASDEESEPEYQYDFEEMPDASSVETIVNNAIGPDRYLHIVHLVGNSARSADFGYLKWHSDISFVFVNNVSSAYTSSATAIYDYLGVSGQGETSEYKPLLSGKVYTYSDATSGDTFKSVVDISYRLDLSYTDANDKVYYGTIPYVAPSITNNYAFVSPANINPTPLYAEDGSVIVITKKNNAYKSSSGDDITVTETHHSNGTKNSEYVITNNIKMNGMTITLDNTTTTTDIYPGDFSISDKVIKL